MNLTVDEKIFSDAQTAAERLKQSFSARDADFLKYEKEYLLDWTAPATEEDIKVTISPDARNAILGAVRIIATTAPRFNCIVGPDEPVGTADRIEEMAKKIWDASSQAYGSPIHETIVESSALYGETHVAINKTADLLSGASKANKRIAQRLAKATPFLIEPWNPHYGYPLSSTIYGTTAYVRVVSSTVGEIAARYGEDGEAWATGKDPTATEDLYIYYDTENYAAWVSGHPFVAMAHKLPFIPISVTLTNGTSLFVEPEKQRQPMLYGITKANLWERENLLLTVLFTNIYHLGLNPTFTHTAPPNNPTKKMAPQSGGVIDLEYGERFEAMMTKGIMDPSFGTAMQLLETKISESTLYKTAMGASLQGSPAYSTYSLLSQSGRLPLVQIQTRTEFAIEDVMTMAIEWYRDSGQALEGYPKPSEIPADFTLEVKMDVNLPQDKLQTANVAVMLKQANIVDDGWIRANILNIDNSTKMTEAIWSQQAADALMQMYLQQRIQAMMAQQIQPGGPGGPGPGQAGPGMPGIGGANPNGMPLGNLGVPTPNNMVSGQGFNPAAGGMPANAAGTLPAVSPEAPSGQF